MAISKENLEFIENQIQYYINEAESYTEIAKEYEQNVESIPDIAFGIIVGSIYTSFLQAYSNQQITADLEDIQEFTEIMKSNSQSIKDAILGEKQTEPIS